AQTNMPAQRADLAHDAAYECGLARPVGSDDGCHGAFPKCAACIAHRDPVAPAQKQLIKRDGGHVPHQPSAQLLSIHNMATTTSMPATRHPAEASNAEPR